MEGVSFCVCVLERGPDRMTTLLLRLQAGLTGSQRIRDNETPTFVDGLFYLGGIGELHFDVLIDDLASPLLSWF